MFKKLFNYKSPEPARQEIDEHFDNLYSNLKFIAKQEGYERDVATAVMNIFKALGTCHDADQVTKEDRMELARTIVVTTTMAAMERNQLQMLVEVCVTNPFEVTDNYMKLANSYE